jgi:hypothetical protein
LWETAPVMKIFNITGCVRLKMRVRVGSIKRPVLEGPTLPLKAASLIEKET